MPPKTDPQHPNTAHEDQHRCSPPKINPLYNARNTPSIPAIPRFSNAQKMPLSRRSLHTQEAKRITKQERLRKEEVRRAKRATEAQEADASDRKEEDHVAIYLLGFENPKSKGKRRLYLNPKSSQSDFQVPEFQPNELVEPLRCQYCASGGQPNHTFGRSGVEHAPTCTCTHCQKALKKCIAPALEVYQHKQKNYYEDDATDQPPFKRKRRATQSEAAVILKTPVVANAFPNITLDMTGAVEELITQQEALKDVIFALRNVCHDAIKMQTQ